MKNLIFPCVIYILHCVLFCSTAIADDDIQPVNPDTLSFTGINNKDYSFNEEEMAFIRAKEEAIVKYIEEKKRLHALEQQLKEQHKSEAQAAIIQEEFPLDPKFIKQQRTMVKSIEEAKNSPLFGTAEMLTRQIEINPKKTNVIEVYTTEHYNASISFIDSMGTPWPVQIQSQGSKDAFDINVAGESQHMVTVFITKPFSETTATLTISKSPYPIILKLIGSAKKVDSAMTVNITGVSPLDSTEVILPTNIGHQLNQVDQLMLNLLNGDTSQLPEDTKEYQLKNITGSAWLIKDYLYIKVAGKLLMPSPTGVLPNTRGEYLYKIRPSENLLISSEGRLLNVTVDLQDKIQLYYQPSIFE